MIYIDAIGKVVMVMRFANLVNKVRSSQLKLKAILSEVEKQILSLSKEQQ
jgi:hypothetical protein